MSIAEHQKETSAELVKTMQRSASILTGVVAPILLLRVPS